MPDDIQLLKIAILGCGAVTQESHLPALKALGVVPFLLVDKSLQRARELARSFGVPYVDDDYRAYVGEIEAAIVALPHYLHAPVCVDLLRQGIHVLVEKPMALTATECTNMIHAEKYGNAVLAVGLTRRFRAATQWVKAVLDAGLLGTIESFDFREGSVFNWPVASDFFFRKEAAGGGVLIDAGAHTLDLLLWWLGDVVSFEYYDDSYGGVEADCELYLTLTSGAQGVVELSRTRNLRNSAILRGQRGEIEVSLHSNRLIARPPEILAYESSVVSGNRLPKQSYEELFVLQIKDWLKAIESRQIPRVPGTEAARSIAWIKACYEKRQLLELPWVRPDKLQPDELQVKAKQR
jgi:predicted dehydrogenase